MPPEATSRPQAEFFLDVAEKLLAARDLVGSRRFALQALDADPILDGVDEVLAVADVLLASEKRVNNHLDWYAVLRLDPSLSSAAVPLDAIKRKYRRLALLLHPDKNRAAGSDAAYKLVLDAWSVLSDSSAPFMTRSATWPSASSPFRKNAIQLLSRRRSPPEGDRLLNRSARRRKWRGVSGRGALTAATCTSTLGFTTAGMCSVRVADEGLERLS